MRVKIGARVRFRARPELIGEVVGKVRIAGAPYPWFVRWDHQAPDDEPQGPFATKELEAIA